MRDITLDAERRLAGGWRPRRKRRGGLGAWLLDGNPLGRRGVFRAARKQVVRQTRGAYPAPLAALEAVGPGVRHRLRARLKRGGEVFGPPARADGVRHARPD